MIKLEDLLRITHLNTILSRVKTYVDDSISALAGAVTDVMEDVDDSITSLENGKEALIKDATAKTTLADADTIPLSDSAASSATKKITFANLKAALESYFDQQYNKYEHPTSTGNKHVPAGGASGQILKWSADGTAAWGDPDSGGGGLEACEVEFNDASVVETYSDRTLTTVFNDDGSITETMVKGGATVIRTTVFNADGSVSQTVA